MEMTPLLNAKQVAALLNVGLTEVYALADEGKIARYKFGRRNVRFHPDDIRAYMDAHREPQAVDLNEPREIPY